MIKEDTSRDRAMERKTELEERNDQNQQKISIFEMARQIHPLAPHLLHNHTCRRENGKIR
jgi:hypothetical protein